MNAIDYYAIEAEDAENAMKVARVIHEATHAYHSVAGVPNSKPWDDLDEEAHQASAMMVLAIMSNPDVGYREAHNTWFEDKRSEGWVFGDALDVEGKRHPHCMPFDELPEHVRVHNALFYTIVGAIISS